MRLDRPRKSASAFVRLSCTGAASLSRWLQHESTAPFQHCWCQGLRPRRFDRRTKKRVCLRKIPHASKIRWNILSLTPLGKVTQPELEGPRPSGSTRPSSMWAPCTRPKRSRCKLTSRGSAESIRDARQGHLEALQNDRNCMLVGPSCFCARARCFCVFLAKSARSTLPMGGSFFRMPSARCRERRGRLQCDDNVLLDEPCDQGSTFSSTHNHINVVVSRCIGRSCEGNLPSLYSLWTRRVRPNT